MVKTEDSQKKIFYIEKVDFLRSMIEYAIRAKGAEIYTVDTLENNFYLLDELVPDLIIFDVQTVLNQLENLKKYKKKAQFVAVGDEGDQILVADLASTFYTKPLEAKNIANRLLALLD